MMKYISDALKIQFLNPFHQDTEKSKFHNLVLGHLVDDAICDSL